MIENKILKGFCSSLVISILLPMGFGTVHADYSESRKSARDIINEINSRIQNQEEKQEGLVSEREQQRRNKIQQELDQLRQRKAVNRDSGLQQAWKARLEGPQTEADRRENQIGEHMQRIQRDDINRELNNICQRRFANANPELQQTSNPQDEADQRETQIGEHMQRVQRDDINRELEQLRQRRRTINRDSGSQQAWRNIVNSKLVAIRLWESSVSFALLME